MFADNSVGVYDINVPEGVTGYPFINKVQLLKSATYSLIQGLDYAECRLLYPEYDSEAFYTTPPNEYYRCMEGKDTIRQILLEEEQARYNELQATGTSVDEKIAILNNREIWEVIPHKSNIRPAYIDNTDIVLSYSKYVARAYTSPFVANLNYCVDQHLGENSAYNASLQGFDRIGWGDVTDPVIYGIGDVVGLIPGADVVTDGLSFLYASLLRKDPYNSALYGAAFLVPGMQGGLFKAATGRYLIVAEHRADGVFYVLHQDDGTYGSTLTRGAIKDLDDVEDIASLEDYLISNSYGQDNIYNDPSFPLNKSNVVNIRIAREISEDVFFHTKNLYTSPTVNKLNATLADFLTGFTNREARQAALHKLDELQHRGLYDDFIGDLAAGGAAYTNFFRSAPFDIKRVKAWEALIGDGSSIFRLYSRNIEDLELLYDYIKFNPTKYDQLKSGYIDAPDKRSWLDDL